jgi:hypothetical protein
MEKQINDLQLQFKQKLVALKTNKGLKNNEIANVTGRSESVISEILADRRQFNEKLIFSMQGKLSDYFQENGLVTSLRQYIKMNNIAESCKKSSDMRLVVGNTGIGKSVVFKKFAADNPDVYYFKADRSYSWNTFLLEINRVMGIEVVKHRSGNLFSNIIDKVEATSGNSPLLIIDEAEVLRNPIFKEIKNLHTATEGLLGIIIVGITSVKMRIAKLAWLDPYSWKPNREDNNIYTTFARRLKVFRIENISPEDITEFCHTKGIGDETIIKLAIDRWWNYEEADRAIKRAISFNFDLTSITIDEFNLL